MCSYYFVSEGRLSVYLFRKSLRIGLCYGIGGAPAKLGGEACSKSLFYLLLTVVSVGKVNINYCIALASGRAVEQSDRGCIVTGKRVAV